MAKLMLYICIAVFVIGVITAAPDKKKSCGRHGADCVSDNDCCDAIKCNRFAHRCKAEVDWNEFMAKRKQILGRDGPDQ